MSWSPGTSPVERRSVHGDLLTSEPAPRRVDDGDGTTEVGPHRQATGELWGPVMSVGGTWTAGDRFARQSSIRFRSNPLPLGVQLHWWAAAGLGVPWGQTPTSALFALGGIGPALAAVFRVHRHGGVEERNLWQRLTDWRRVPGRWWVGVPVLAVLPASWAGGSSTAAVRGSRSEPCPSWLLASSSASWRSRSGAGTRGTPSRRATPVPATVCQGAMDALAPRALHHGVAPERAGAVVAPILA